MCVVRKLPAHDDVRLEPSGLAAAVKQATPKPLDAGLALGNALVKEFPRIKLLQVQQVGQHEIFSSSRIECTRAAPGPYVLSTCFKGDHPHRRECVNVQKINYMHP